MNKYKPAHKKCLILTICVDWLEKDRQYELSSYVLTHLLLQNHVKDSSKRGQWWLRLTIDLKHLKLRKESLKISQHALLYDQGSVKSGVKNGLLKNYESLEKSFATKAKPKKTRKK